MAASPLETFLSTALEQSYALSEPADAVEAIAPLLLDPLCANMNETRPLP